MSTRGLKGALASAGQTGGQSAILGRQRISLAIEFFKLNVSLGPNISCLSSSRNVTRGCLARGRGVSGSGGWRTYCPARKTTPAEPGNRTTRCGRRGMKGSVWAQDVPGRWPLRVARTTGSGDGTGGIPGAEGSWRLPRQGFRTGPSLVVHGSVGTSSSRKKLAFPGRSKRDTATPPATAVWVETGCQFVKSPETSNTI